ncbi:MAG: noncanonical pyrimidine nucleotidase, YjjG family, partial [Oscillospiraceae bacterium]|nr:noncanonical pyrimidine nucleotidase, YjjG family [Oscillospiraceae bacterium]
MPRYDFILLDADRTLFDFDAGEKLALLKTLNHYGLPSSPEIHATYVEENNKAWDLFEQGKVTKAELTILRYRTFLDRIGCQGDPEELNRFYTADLSTHCIPFEDAEEVCRTLADHCALYIVTNGISTVQKERMSR